MTEKQPPRGEQGAHEDPPIDPEVLARSEEMYREANALYGALVEDLRAKGLRISDVQKEMDEAAKALKEIKGIINHYKRRKTLKGRTTAETAFKSHIEAFGYRVAADVMKAADEFIAARRQGGSEEAKTKAETKEDLKNAIHDLTQEEIERNEAEQGAYNKAAHEEEEDEAIIMQDRRKERIDELEKEIDELTIQMPSHERSAINDEIDAKQAELKELKAYHGMRNEDAPPDNTHWDETIKTEEEKEDDKDKAGENLKAKARATRGDAAIDDLEQKLGAGRRTNKEEFDKSVPHAEKMYDAEKAYLDALKAHHRARGIGSVMAEQFLGHKESKEVQELRTKWIESRSEYAGYLKGSAKERLIKEHGDSLDPEKMKYHNAALERYQRMVIAREVVFGAEEAEQRAKMEGLSERHRGWVDKAFEGYKKLPPGVRILGTAALFAGVAATTAGLAAPAAAYMAGRAGLNWFAAAQAGTAHGALVGTLLKWSSVGAIAGVAAELGVRGYHAVAGTKAKAKETLAQRDTSGADNTPEGIIAKATNLDPSSPNFDKRARKEYDKQREQNAKLRSKNVSKDDLTNIGNLERISKDRKKSINVDENIARQGRWARFVGALFGTGGKVLEGELHHTVAAAQEADAGPHIATLKEYAETGKASTGIPEGTFDSHADTSGLTAENMAHAEHLSHPDAPHATAEAAPVAAPAAEPTHEQAPEHHEQPAEKPEHEKPEEHQETPAPAPATATEEHTDAPSAESTDTPSEAHPAEAALAPEHVVVPESHSRDISHEDMQMIEKWEDQYGGLPSHADDNIHDVIARLHENNGPDVFNGVHYEAAPPGSPDAWYQPTHAESHNDAVVDPVHPDQPVSAPEVAPEAPSAPESDLGTINFDLAHHSQSIHEALQSGRLHVVPSDDIAHQAQTLGQNHDAFPERHFGDVPAHFVNPHHVDVNLTKAHFYSWKMPNSKDVFPVIDGGTPEERLAFIKEMLSKHHKELDRVLGVGINPDTHQPELQEFRLDASGHMFMPIGTVMNPENGQPVPVPDPNDYIASPNV